MSDWNPEQYKKFLAQRTRPSIDLAERVTIAPRSIFDLGCGRSWRSLPRSRARSSNATCWNRWKPSTRSRKTARLCSTSRGCSSSRINKRTPADNASAGDIVIDLCCP